MTSADLDSRGRIWNRPFTGVFIAAFLIETTWSLLLHLPGFLTDLGASEGDIGVLYATAALAGLLFRPLVGRLLDLRGRKPVLMVAGVIEGLLVASYALVERFGPEVFAIRVVQGTAQIVLFTALLTYAADALPAERRTQGLALFGLSGLIPIGMGGVLGDVVIGIGGFTTLFLVGGAFAAVGLVVLATLPVLGMDPSDTAPRRSVWAAVRQRDLIPLWILGLAFAVAMETLFTFMRTFVDASGVGTVGLFFGTYAAVAVVVRIFASGIGDRRGSRTIVLPSATAMAATFGLLAITTGEPLFLLAAALGGIGHGLLFPVLSSQVVARSRSSERGSAVAILTSLFDIAILGAMPIVGGLIDVAGYTVAFTTVGVVMAAGTAGFLALDRKPQPAQAQV